MRKVNENNQNIKKVLITEDDVISLRAMTQYLDSAGFSYVVAHDGQQAWQYLQQDPEGFFVVLADRMMPKLHGLELFSRMQKTALSNIPFILLTGEASKEERCAAIAQGIYDFFYKPISAELLISVLKKLKNRDQNHPRGPVF